jgi:hypothetical protein
MSLPPKRPTPSDDARAAPLAANASIPPGNALKTNITTLGPLVLPISEQLLFGANLLMRKLLGKKRLPGYVPDFKLAFEHLCIHTGEALPRRARIPGPRRGCKIARGARIRMQSPRAPVSRGCLSPVQGCRTELGADSG